MCKRTCVYTRVCMCAPVLKRTPRSWQEWDWWLVCHVPWPGSLGVTVGTMYVLGPFIALGDQSPACLPACRPLEGVTGLALQVQGPGLPLTEKDGQSTAWQCGRGGRRGGCPRPWQPRGPRPQAQMTKLGEEMSLRFLKREARLCGFLQKSFLALEKVGA